MRGVVGQINISLTQCRNFPISIPSLEEQMEIVKIVDLLFEKIEIYISQNKFRVNTYDNIK